jgi:hypothetical protein
MDAYGHEEDGYILIAFSRRVKGSWQRRAIAIGLSKARKKGAKVPRKKSK